MTWYASHIYTLGGTDVIACFQRQPRVAGHLYWVKGHLPDAMTPGAAVELPSRGLVVLRELCEPESHEWEWHRGNALPWDLGAPAPSLVPPVAFAMEGAATVLPEHVELPPAALVDWLRAIALECGQAVAYYHHATWGGTTEEEYAIVLGANTWFYAHREDEAVVRVRDGKHEEVPDVTVLQACLADVGVRVPTAYFPLHRVPFPWALHRR
jgi:hypothetical protein